jgi:hypothetical protein
MTIDEARQLPARQLLRVILQSLGFPRHRWGGAWGQWVIDGERIVIAGSPAHERIRNPERVKIVDPDGEWMVAMVSRGVRALRSGQRQAFLAALRQSVGLPPRSTDWPLVEVFAVEDATPRQKLEALAVVLV